MLHVEVAGTAYDDCAVNVQDPSRATRRYWPLKFNPDGSFTAWYTYADRVGMKVAGPRTMRKLVETD